MEKQLKHTGTLVTFLIVVTMVSPRILHAEMHQGSPQAPEIVEVAIYPVIDGSADDEDNDGVWDADTLQTTSTSLLAYNARPSGYNWHAAIEFPLTAIPASAVIEDATFYLRYVAGSGLPAQTLRFNSYAGDGMLTMADFAVSNQIGPMYNAFGPQDGTRWYKAPATSFIQSLIDSDEDYAGLMIENVTRNQTALNSRMGGPDYSPRLEVSYVPEPATLSLLALGGLALLRRRKRGVCK